MPGNPLPTLAQRVTVVLVSISPYTVGQLVFEWFCFCQLWLLCNSGFTISFAHFLWWVSILPLLIWTGSLLILTTSVRLVIMLRFVLTSFVACPFSSREDSWKICRELWFQSRVRIFPRKLLVVKVTLLHPDSAPHIPPGFAVLVFLAFICSCWWYGIAFCRNHYVHISFLVWTPSSRVSRKPGCFYKITLSIY